MDFDLRRFRHGENAAVIIHNKFLWEDVNHLAIHRQGDGARRIGCRTVASTPRTGRLATISSR